MATKLTQSRAAALALETQAILWRGQYQLASGERCDIQSALVQARKATQFHAPDWCAPTPPLASGQPRFQAGQRATLEVRDATTLQAACELHARHLQPVVLNFASPFSPGGGWLLGARAQEEYLCRNSGLAACLRGQPFYRVPAQLVPPLFSDALLYSPAVPVIRDEDHNLATPWPVSIITAAAPNVRVIPAGAAALHRTFENRWHKVLALAHLHGHRSVVLGAWGCGAFHNDPRLVATAFLQVWPQWNDAFTEVWFAIPQGTRDKNLAVFQEVLAHD